MAVVNFTGIVQKHPDVRASEAGTLTVVFPKPLYVGNGWVAAADIPQGFVAAHSLGVGHQVSGKFEISNNGRAARVTDVSTTKRTHTLSL